MKAPPEYYLHLSQTLLHFMEQREKLWKQYQGNSDLTLSLLQDIKAGVVDVQRLVISDDGWQLMPPEPDEEAPQTFSSNGASKTLAEVINHE